MKTTLTFGLVISISACIAIQTPLFSYTYSVSQDSLQTGAGHLTHWNLEAFSDGKIPYNINPNRPQNSGQILPEGTTVEQIIRDIQNGFQAWENINTSAAGFSFQGLSDQSAPAIDGANLVTMDADPSSEGNCGTAFTRVVSCLEEGLCGLPNGKFVKVDFPGQIIDADIVFCSGSNSETLSIDGSADSDVQARTTHEVGHFLGFAHTGILPGTMYGYASFDNIGIANRSRQSLSADDAISASTLYPDNDFLKETGSIRGTVRDINSNPLFGVEVAAVNSDGIIVASAVAGVSESDANGIPMTFSLTSGDYIINGLPPGIYTLYAAPLNGPPAGATNSGLFNVDNINLNFNTLVLSNTVSVDKGAVTSGIDLQVSPLDPNAPNIDVLTFTDTPSGVIASGVGFFGDNNNLRIGFGENIVSVGSILKNAAFGISGIGVTITASPFINGSFISIPISIDSGIPLGPRNVTVNTPDGLSILGGGLIISEMSPRISSINPSSGQPGDTVAVSGEGFLPDSVVTIEGVMVSSIIVHDLNSITIEIPQPFSGLAGGAADIGVNNDAGRAILSDVFVYDQNIPVFTPTPQPSPAETPTTPTETATPTPAPTPPTPRGSPVFPTPTPPLAPVPSSLTVVPVSAESSTRFKTAAVTVLDQNERPIQGLVIRAFVNGHGGVVLPQFAATNPNGEARFKFRFRHIADNAEIIFSAAGLTATIRQE